MIVQYANFLRGENLCKVLALTGAPLKHFQMSFEAGYVEIYVRLS